MELTKEVYVDLLALLMEYGYGRNKAVALIGRATEKDGVPGEAYALSLIEKAILAVTAEDMAV